MEEEKHIWWTDSFFTFKKHLKTHLCSLNVQYLMLHFLVRESNAIRFSYSVEGELTITALLSRLLDRCDVSDVLFASLLCRFGEKCLLNK